MTIFKMSYFRFIAFSLFFLFAIVFIVSLTSKTMTVDQQFNSLIAGIVSVIVGMIFLLIDRKPAKTKAWNDLPFEEQCRLTAIDLKMGRRSWFLNPLTAEEGGGFNAVILSPNNMNEMGGGMHIETTEEDICKLLLDGKIKNPEMANGVMTYL
jgi:hypothetical protein